jgi:hypothetical protein
MKSLTFYLTNGCMLGDLVSPIYYTSNAKPCIGCRRIIECKCYKLVKDAEEIENAIDKAIKSKARVTLMTNADLATVRGVSKRFVSKHRVAGTNRLDNE